jgi:glycosyltransferase involved in cell wall biosynthesis
MKIIGHIVCQDGLPDILRAIESIYSICDETYVVDGGSKDGTREFLEARKEIYNLKIFDRKYDTLGNQRNFLLEQTEKNNWIVTLDQDEKYSLKTQTGLREFLLEWVSSLVLTEQPRDLPLVVPINHWNLTKDIYHCDGKPIYHNQKVFYYDRNLHWYKDYFCHIAYDEKDEGLVNALPTVCGFSLLHYARLDPQRLKERNKHTKDSSHGNYAKDDWNKYGEVVELPFNVR